MSHMKPLLAQFSTLSIVLFPLALCLVSGLVVAVTLSTGDTLAADQDKVATQPPSNDQESGPKVIEPLAESPSDLTDKPEPTVEPEPADPTKPATKSPTKPAAKPYVKPASKPATKTYAPKPTTKPYVKPSATPTQPYVKPSAKPTTSPTPLVVSSKLLVIVEENHSFNQMKAGMPYLFSQAQKYAYATNFSAITHPSLPNYIALLAGDTLGVKDNGYPSSHKLTAPTVLGKALAAGKTAKIYADSMPSNCYQKNSGKFATRHIGWTYFTKERSYCDKYVVPFAKNFDKDVAAGALPNASLLIPDNCHNAHDCSLVTADAWFKDRMATVFNGPDWKSGKLIVVVTADEDDKKSGNKVLTVVMAPRLKNKVVSSSLSLYSLSRLFSEITRTTPLLKAQSAPSMNAAFGLLIR